MYINQAPYGDASIYKIKNDDSTSKNRIKKQKEKENLKLTRKSKKNSKKFGNQ